MTDFVSIDIKTDGKLKKIVRQLQNADDKALGRVAQQVHRELKKTINTMQLLGKSKQLRKTTTVKKIKRMHYHIGPTRKYAKWVNYGTGIHSPGGQGWITPKNTKVLHWVDKEGDEHFAPFVEGQEPAFFLEATVYKATPQVNRWYNDYLAAEINRILTGSGGGMGGGPVPGGL